MDVKGPGRDVEMALAGVEGVEDVSRTPGQGRGFSSYLVEATQGVEVRAQLATAIVEGGWDLLRLEAIGMTLEEIFLRLTTSEEVAAA